MLLMILLTLAYAIVLASCTAPAYEAWESRGMPRLEEL